MKESFLPAHLFYSGSRRYIQNKSFPSPAPSRNLGCLQPWDCQKVGASAVPRPPPLWGAWARGHARRGRGWGAGLRPGVSRTPGARTLAQSSQPAAPAAPFLHRERQAPPYLHTVIRFLRSTAALRALRLFLPPQPPPPPPLPPPRLPLLPPRFLEAMAG